MNTADRSIVLFDAALRRRFEFIPLFPDYHLLAQVFDISAVYDEDEFRTELTTLGYPDNGGTVHRGDNVLSVLSLEKINSELTADRSIGREKQIGHTYFLPLQEFPNYFKKIWKQQIIPLLEEYYYESPDKLEEMFGEDIFEEQLGIKDFDEETLRSALLNYIKPEE
jgi:5-methylcytosine-specific restriction protein B